MRRVLLVLLPILLVFGIPWLASEFRGDDKAAAPAGATVSSTRDNQRAASVLPSQMLAKCQFTSEPGSGQARNGFAAAFAGVTRGGGHHGQPPRERGRIGFRNP